MLLETLNLQSGMSALSLARFEKTASAKYKVYYIPKRDGTLRKIEHPSRELKALQRWLNAFLLQSLPQHPNATAYSRGASIKANALRHLGSKFTIRLDFQDFFPSFKESGIKKFLVDASDQFGLSLTQGDIRFASRIFCRNGALTIGAPTSPALTNRMMFEFDRAVTAVAEQQGLVYTRYADDIFISSFHPNKLNSIIPSIKEIASKFPYARLKINHKKTAFLSKKYRRSVTGLLITPDDKISVGRHSKRKIKGLIWRLQRDGLSQEDRRYLSGYIAFLRDVEPAFVTSLIQKYGHKLFELAADSAE